MAALVILSLPITVSAAEAQTVVWENRGQPESEGFVTDIDRAGDVIVAPGGVGDESGQSRWFVRAVDRSTGATSWEDRFGEMRFAAARDVEIMGDHAFVAGWTRTTGQGFDFTVRAHDLDDGDVVWSRQISRGPQCVEETPGFARCVAKAVAADGGRVFAVGHVTATAARSDFAVFAFDATTGAQLWRSVIDPTGTGVDDFAWAVAASGDSLFVVGEIGWLPGGVSAPPFSGLLLRSYDVEQGTLRWEQKVPGATNFTFNDSLAVVGDHVVISGMDVSRDYMVRAYDADTGAFAWSDSGRDGVEAGAAWSLTAGPRSDAAGAERALFAAGLVGCNPITLVECELAIRGYDPASGDLLWKREDVAQAGDWGLASITADAGRVFVSAQELLNDGQYHRSIRGYGAQTGAPLWTTPWDPGGNPPGFAPAVHASGSDLYVGGAIHADPSHLDYVLRLYDPSGNETLAPGAGPAPQIAGQDVRGGRRPANPDPSLTGRIPSGLRDKLDTAENLLGND